MNLSNEQIKKILDNAPEGATHWWTLFNSNFINGDGFYGVYEEDVLLGGDLWNQIPLSDLRKRLDGVEWDGKGLPPIGCKIRTKEGVSEVLSVSDFDGGVVTYSYDDGMSIGCAWNNKSWINPIETHQQREERERLESAYDLYCLWGGDKQESFGSFSRCNVDNWLAIVDKTKYRKEVGLYRA